MSIVRLSSEQLVRIEVLRSAKEYPAMYDYLHKIVIAKIADYP